MVSKVSINTSRLQRLVGIIREHLKVWSTGEIKESFANHPAASHPLIVEFYLLTILHQFGFWELAEGRYAGAWYGVHAGKPLRGSDFVWARMTEFLKEKPQLFSLDGDFTLEPVECEALVDEGGRTPPLWQSHLELSKRLRRSLHPSGLKPLREKIRASCNKSQAFRESFGNLPGYCEDPHLKKLNLLYMYLSGRAADNPLQLDARAIATVAVDYHIMRFLLRFGVLQINDSCLTKRLCNRTESDDEEEKAIRAAAVKVVASLLKLTNASPFAVDQFLFSFRQLCNDSAAGPDCDCCPIKHDCAQAKELFQPLLRARTWY
jgi:hypothetical protein